MPNALPLKFCLESVINHLMSGKGKCLVTLDEEDLAGVNGMNTDQKFWVTEVQIRDDFVYINVEGVCDQGVTKQFVLTPNIKDFKG